MASVPALSRRGYGLRIDATGAMIRATRRAGVCEDSPGIRADLLTGLISNEFRRPGVEAMMEFEGVGGSEPGDTHPGEKPARKI